MSERSVLLTGATGFLGGELLQRLLDRESRRIVCLVRAPDASAAAERGRGILGEAASRVHWLPGDIERPRFGLDARSHDALVAEVEEIFHCAATTRFDLPLADAQRVNVTGVERVLDLAERAAARGGLRRLNHVSTAYAAGRRADEVRAGELPDDRASRFRNTYERTKARAERRVRASGVPVTVHRPSIIVGRSHDGHTTGWTTVYYPMRLVAKGKLPHFPYGGRQLLDCVPVDFVADAIVALARRDDTRGGVYHLTAGAEALTVAEGFAATLEGLERNGWPRERVRTRLVGPAAWWCLDRGYGVLARGRARQTLAQLRAYVPYTRVSAVYDNRRELELLAKEGVYLTPPREFFPRVVDYALRTDFGRAAPDATSDA